MYEQRFSLGGLRFYEIALRRKVEFDIIPPLCGLGFETPLQGIGSAANGRTDWTNDLCPRT